MSLRPATPFLLLLLLAGCASSDPLPDEDANGDDTTEEDTGAEEDTGTEEDTDEEDTTEDVEVTPEVDVPDAPPADIVEVDAASDVNVSSCEIVGSECEPFTSACSAATNSVIYCGRCGFVLDEEACGDQGVCDDTDGTAGCRDCEGDECLSGTECTPGTVSCLNFETQQACTEDGVPGAITRCGEGRRCLQNGECSSAGQDTGAACTTNLGAASGCAGQLCVCGPEYTATSGATGCEGALATGYCSTDDCAATGCDPASEVCVSFAATGAFASQNFCVNQERCTFAGQSCGSRAGFVCQELPVRTVGSTVVSWDWACWADLGLQAISETCTTDADCAGGECVRTGSGDATLSYCTAPCDRNRECPSTSRCVADPRGGGDFICLASANPTDCPRLGRDFNVRTYAYRTLAGSTADVCFIPVR
jgi:hypothetical protein